jgi:hypothetical protein
MSFCTSLMQAGDHIALIVLIFSELTSIPRYEIRKPRSFPTVTLKTYLSVFNLVRVRRNLSKKGKIVQ